MWERWKERWSLRNFKREAGVRLGDSDRLDYIYGDIRKHWMIYLKTSGNIGYLEISGCIGWYIWRYQNILDDITGDIRKYWIIYREIPGNIGWYIWRYQDLLRHLSCRNDSRAPLRIHLLSLIRFCDRFLKHLDWTQLTAWLNLIMFFQSEGSKGSHFAVSTSGIIGEFHEPKGLGSFDTAEGICVQFLLSKNSPDRFRAVLGHTEIRFYGQPFLSSGDWIGASSLQDKIPWDP